MEIQTKDELKNATISQLLLKMGGISKSFGAVKALQKVDFELYYNEVVGLVGDNGAGKSTLIKIISGALIPDEGEIFFEGKKINVSSPEESRELGIGVMYQDLALVDSMDIVNNVFLGKPLTINLFGGAIELLNKKRMQNECWKILQELDMNFDSLRRKTKALSGGQRKAVAIGRALYWKAKLIIMDEPTAALGVKELRKVLDLIKGLKEKGVSVIFISHNLQEIFSTVDRIVVLRRGELGGVRKADETNADEIIKLMVG